MADETPVVVTRRQKPGEPPLFEQELSGRVDTAQERFKAAHPELFPPAPNPLIKTETTTLPTREPEEEPPPASLPVIEEPAPEPVEPVKEPPPAPTPAPEQPPQAAEAPKPPPPKEDFDWRSFRRLERENRRLQRELEASKKVVTPSGPIIPVSEPKPDSPTPPVSAPPPSDDDPLGIKAAVREATDAIRGEYEQREQQRLTRDQENEQRRFEDELTRTEREFSTAHPDYYDAVNHIANWERQRYQLTGMAQARAAEMINDPQWTPVIEKVADEFVFVPDPNHNGILLTARREQLTPEQRQDAREMSDAEAAICVATDLWIRDRRNDILSGARAQRRPVPDVVWDLATKVAGYTPRQAAGLPAVAQSPVSNGNGSGNGQSAAARIRQQARVNAASRTLSSMSSGMPGEPQPQQIRSLREWTEFHQRDPQGARAYADRMSRIDPNWHRNLQA